MSENLLPTADTPAVSTFKNEGDQSSRLFDLRYLIGGIMTLYGLILVVVGFTDGSSQLAKASGIRINLWMGLLMVVVGVFFLVWARLRPLLVEGPSAAAKAEAAAATEAAAEAPPAEAPPAEAATEASAEAAQPPAADQPDGV